MRRSCRAYALRDGREYLIATMTGTLMAMQRREGASVPEWGAVAGLIDKAAR